MVIDASRDLILLVKEFCVKCIRVTDCGFGVEWLWYRWLIIRNFSYLEDTQFIYFSSIFVSIELNVIIASGNNLKISSISYGS